MSAKIEDCSDVDPYDRILRSFSQDPRLPFKAIGVLTFLKSKPSGWETSAEKIASERRKLAREQYGDEVAKGVDGRDAVASGLAALEKYGYLYRRRIQYGPKAGAGQEPGTWGWLWLYSDNPETLVERARTRLSVMLRSGVIVRVAGEDLHVEPTTDSPVSENEESQVEPTTDFPSSEDPSSGDPSSDNPSSQRQEIREENPPTPSEAGGAAISTDGPPACVDHGPSCRSRACGTAPRQQRAAREQAERLSVREGSVVAQVAARDDRAARRKTAAVAGLKARGEIAAILGGKPRRSTPAGRR